MVVTYFVHASSSANLANAKLLLQYSIIRIYDEFFYGSILIHSFFGVPFIVHSTRSLSRQMQAKNKHAHTPPKSVCNEQTGTQAVRTRAFGSILNPPVLAFISWVEYILTNSDSHSHIQRMPLWKLGADRSLLSRAWLRKGVSERLNERESNLECEWECWMRESKSETISVWAWKVTCIYVLFERNLIGSWRIIYMSAYAITMPWWNEIII